MSEAVPSLLTDMKNALFTKYNAKREGVHVSDINLCPRETVFRRIKPYPVTNADLSNFSRGEGMGSALQHLTKFHPGKYTIEKELDFFGLESHIDLYNETDDYPVEIKTYAGKSMDEPKPHYVDQLKSYMAITGKKRGLIFVQLLMQFDDVPFCEFPIYMTDTEIGEKRVQLFNKAKNFKEALDAKNPALAESCMFDEDKNWKCSRCNYLTECQEMNKEQIQARLKQGLPERPIKIKPYKKKVAKQ